MTERTGGSDVGADRDGGAARRRRAGGSTARSGSRSATTAEMALTLARPEGNAGGRRGLALFYVETPRRRRDDERHPA